MINVRHVLKDGTEKKSVSGMVISPEKNPAYYTALEQIVRRKLFGRKDNTKNPGRVA